MHIDVRDLLFDPVGTHRSFTLTDERPELDSLILVEPLEGEIRLTKAESAIEAQGLVKTAIQLECHRCLRTFTMPLEAPVFQVYAEAPEEDELPIIRQRVDLAPAIREALLLVIPIKQLCAEDCAGIRLKTDSPIKKG